MKNKFGIYVYPDTVCIINNIEFTVNSISHTNKTKYRIFNNLFFGFHLYKTYFLK